MPRTLPTAKLMFVLFQGTRRRVALDSAHGIEIDPWRASLYNSPPGSLPADGSPSTAADASRPSRHAGRDTAMLLMVGLLQSVSLANPVKPEHEEQLAQPTPLVICSLAAIAAGQALPRAFPQGVPGAASTPAGCVAFPLNGRHAASRRSPWRCPARSGAGNHRSPAVDHRQAAVQDQPDRARAVRHGALSAARSRTAAADPFRAGTAGRQVRAERSGSFQRQLPVDLRTVGQ